MTIEKIVDNKKERNKKNCGNKVYFQWLIIFARLIVNYYLSIVA